MTTTAPSGAVTFLFTLETMMGDQSRKKLILSSSTRRIWRSYGSKSPSSRQASRQRSVWRTVGRDDIKEAYERMR